MVLLRIHRVGGVIIGAGRGSADFPFCIARPRHCASPAREQLRCRFTAPSRTWDVRFRLTGCAWWRI